MPAKTVKTGDTYTAVTPSGTVLGTHPTKHESQAQATAVKPKAPAKPRRASKAQH